MADELPLTGGHGEVELVRRPDPRADLLQEHCGGNVGRNSISPEPHDLGVQVVREMERPCRVETLERREPGTRHEQYPIAGIKLTVLDRPRVGVGGVRTPAQVGTRALIDVTVVGLDA